MKQNTEYMENKLNSEYFITNSGEKSLAKIITRILPAKADCIDFLVLLKSNPLTINRGQS